MPKRSREEKIERYRKKIRKLQENKKTYRRRIIESDDEDENQCYLESPSEACINIQEPQDNDILIPNDELVQNLLSDCPTEAKSAENISADPPNLEEPSLDPELLSALGETESDSPEYGEKILDSQAKLWLPILKKGVPKEAKDKLLKEYAVPDNCRLLQAPKLNAEIAAALPDMVRNRDKSSLLAQQQQLGLGITACNRALDLLLLNGDKVQAIKHLKHQSCESNREARASNKERTNPKSSSDVSSASWRSSVLPGKLAISSLPVEQRGAGREPTPSSSTADAPEQSNQQHKERSTEQTSCASAAVTQRSTPAQLQPYPGGCEALRQAFAQRGSPPEAITLMLASLADSTMKQYNVTLKLWWQYCSEQDINLFAPSHTSVLSFLSTQFSNGCSYSSLNSHRSALSLLLGNSFTSNDDVKRLLKGAYRLKPATPKYSGTWDPQLVLNFVSRWHPNAELSLEKITKKLVVLLAICTAHRVQTLSLIKLENISFSEQGAKIFITDLIKTSAPGRQQPILKLPYFAENISICPATALRDYIFVTKNKRPASTGRLLLTFKAPHKAATTQSISRWIKQVLSDSGVDTTVFSGHSTRHAATSAAHSRGVSMDTIRKTAGWTSSSNTFARFYNREILEEESFATSVCLN
ncbi:uncharacterized protein LOC135071310 [Ostrinia nubilalis]|uniref:uncharacterized protein LOC135071310 n=1 Tax=Ostrinia nubilalis TaxID=29057 RepID=UPI0030823517